MSHQTGIQPNKELQKVFFESKGGKYRAIKVSIDKEELCCTATFLINKNNWEQEYDAILNKLVEKDVPCYILYRLDEKMSFGYAWLLFTWIPDTANVRNKMMYASTKATLKINFGTSYITEEIHATLLSEINIKEYFKNKIESNSLNKDEELDELKKLEISRDVSTPTAVRTFGGLDFPITEAAIKAIRDLSEDRCNYIQFIVDIQKEVIDLSIVKNVKVELLHKEISNENPQYHLFVFQHFYDGEWRKSNIFIYSIPANVSSIKEKMLFSSCKNSFIERLMQYNILICKKLEIDDPLELNEQFFLDELYPKTAIPRVQFAKPKGPPGRGARRFTKTND